MKTETMCMQVPVSVFCDTKEQLIECEMLLPDYYPEISRILQCDIIPGEEAVTLAGDKISVAGDSIVRLLYVDEEGKAVVFEQHSRYSKIISCCPTETADTAFVTQSVTSVNCRATAPRKAEVRGFAAVRVQIIRLKELSFVSRVEETSCQLKYRNVEAIFVHSVKSIQLRAEDKIENTTGEALAGVAFAFAEVGNVQVKAIPNKISIKGTVSLRISFVNDKGLLLPESHYELPFSDIADMNGCRENDECNLVFSGIQPEITVIKGESGFQASVRLSAVCFLSQKESLQALEDIYSLHTALECQSERGYFWQELSPLDWQSEVFMQMPGGAEGINRVVCAHADISSLHTGITDGQLKVGGSLCADVLYTDESGGLYKMQTVKDFEQVLPFSGESGELFADARVYSVQTGIASGAVEVTARIRFGGFVAAKKEQTLYSSCADSPNGKEHSERLVVYYARAGEPIWSIAKENRSIPEKIRELNGIEGEAVPTAQAVIFPAYS